MADKSKIEWTDATWNPIRGCSRVSEGCRNCYAETVANRFCGQGSPYEGVVQIDADGKGLGKWNGQIKFVEKRLLDPLRWKTPRKIFVNSMSDLFHENVTDEMLDRIFAVMALCPQHTFQILTKRPDRMLAYMSKARPNNMCHIASQLVPWYVWRAVNLLQVGLRGEHMCPIGWDLDDEDRETIAAFKGWPLPNVWLGVSVENQKAADERIPLLLQTPAAVRFLSVEPMLGRVDLMSIDYLQAVAQPGWQGEKRYPFPNMPDEWRTKLLHLLDWVICGGESGPGARPMHPDWARSLRDQCMAAGVPFFFKQWGEWRWEEPTCWSATPEMAGQCYGPFRPTCGGPGSDKRMMCRAYPPVIPGELGKDDRSFVMLQEAHRVGKQATGDLLDGKQWHQFPAVGVTT